MGKNPKDHDIETLIHIAKSGVDETPDVSTDQGPNALISQFILELKLLSGTYRIRAKKFSAAFNKWCDLRGHFNPISTPTMFGIYMAKRLPKKRKEDGYYYFVNKDPVSYVEKEEKKNKKG